MALTPTRKTYPQLTAQALPVQDGDILAGYRSPGPLKRFTASSFADYIKAFFSASGGSDLVGFIQSGTGGVSEAVQATLRRVVYADQYSTVQQAVTAAGSGGTVVFTRGMTYTLTAPVLLAGLSNLHLIGYGATIRSGATRIKSYFDMEDSAGNVTFEGIRFDQRQSSMPVYTQADYANDVYNCPIYARQNSGSAKVLNCLFVDQYTSGIFWRLSDDLTVQNCDFQVPVCNQTFSGTPAAQWYQSIHIQSVDCKIYINNVSFVTPATTNPALPNCAVYASGTSGSFILDGFYTDYHGRDNTGTHRLGAIDFYGDHGNVTIRNGVCRNTLATFSRFSACYDLNIDNVVIEANANTEFDGNCLELQSTVFGSRSGTRNANVSNVTIYDPSSRYNTGVAVLSYDYQAYSRRVKVSNLNTIGVRGSFLVAGPYDDVTLDGFSFDSAAAAAGAGVNGLLAPGGATLTGMEATSFYDNLMIRNGVIRNFVSGNGSSGVRTQFNNAATTAKVGKITVENVTVVGTANTGQGIIMQQASTTPANSQFFVRNCTVTGYNYNIYARDGGYQMVEFCKFGTAGTLQFLDQSAGALNRRGNSVGNGALRLTGTLVAGTVTINSNEIVTDSNYPTRFNLSRRAAGTANGFLTFTASAGQIIVTSKDAANATVATDNGTFEVEFVN
jgi:hypothetical protein